MMPTAMRADEWVCHRCGVAFSVGDIVVGQIVKGLADGNPNYVPIHQVCPKVKGKKIR